jgi:hypothetical protein
MYKGAQVYKGLPLCPLITVDGWRLNLWAVDAAAIRQLQAVATLKDRSDPVTASCLRSVRYLGEESTDISIFKLVFGSG